MPDAALVAAHVGGVVDGLVDAGDREAGFDGRGEEALGDVGEADAVIEAAGAVLGEDEVAAGGEGGHRDVDAVPVGGAAGEGVLAGEVVAEPGAGDERGDGLLVGGEVAVEGEEDEGVLLGARPVAGAAVGEEAGGELGGRIRSSAGRRSGPPRRMPLARAAEARSTWAPSSYQVTKWAAPAVSVTRFCTWRRSSASSLDDPGSRESVGQIPAEGLDGELVDAARLGDELAGPGGVGGAAEVEHVQGVGEDGAPRGRAGRGGDVLADVGQVPVHGPDGVLGDAVALLEGARQGVGDVDREVGGGSSWSQKPQPPERCWRARSRSRSRAMAASISAAGGRPAPKAPSTSRRAAMTRTREAICSLHSKG